MIDELPTLKIASVSASDSLKGIAIQGDNLHIIVEPRLFKFDSPTHGGAMTVRPPKEVTRQSRDLRLYSTTKPGISVSPCSLSRIYASNPAARPE